MTIQYILEMSNRYCHFSKSISSLNFGFVNFLLKMSNAFEELMSQSTKQRKPSTSSAGGRPMHNSWLGYEKKYVNGKVAAKCSKCLRTFNNTAKDRLNKHR